MYDNFYETCEIAKKRNSFEEKEQNLVGDLKKIPKKQKRKLQRKYLNRYRSSIITDFGSEEQFFEIFQSVKAISRSQRPQRRSIKRNVLTGARDKINDKIRDSSVPVLFSSFQSFRNWDRERLILSQERQLNKEEEPTKRSKRLSIGYGVKGIKFPSSKDVSSLYFSQFFQGFQTKRPDSPNQWKRQGFGYFVQVEQVIISQMKKIFDCKLFNLEDLSTRKEKPIRIHLSVSGDGSKLSKTAENNSSNYIALCLEIIFDDRIFLVEDGVKLVCSLLPWYLVSDKETHESMQNIGRMLMFCVKEVNSICNWYLTPQGIVHSNQKTHESSSTHSDTDVWRRSLDFKVLFFKGDSKFLQIITGTPCSTSPFRCYLCSVPQSQWLNPDFISFGFKTPRYLENYFSSFFIFLEQFLQKSSSEQSKSNFPSFFPLYADLDTVENLIAKTNSWSLHPVLDPLHLIENHSRELMKFVMEKFPKVLIAKLQTFFTETLQLPLRDHYSVGKWRLVWCSYHMHIEKILNSDSEQLEEPSKGSQVLSTSEKKKIISLMWSWSWIIKFLYLPIPGRNIKVWFRYFAVSYYHFTLWIEEKPKALLGVHLLWPHSVDQFWNYSMGCCSMEKQEYSWKILRILWKNCCGSKNDREKLFLGRWWGNQNSRTIKSDHHQNRIQKTISEYSKSIILQDISVRWSSEKEKETIIKYLKAKKIPKELYQCDNTSNSFIFYLTHHSLDRNEENMKDFTVNSLFYLKLPNLNQVSDTFTSLSKRSFLKQRKRFNSMMVEENVQEMIFSGQQIFWNCFYQVSGTREIENVSLDVSIPALGSEHFTPTIPIVTQETTIISSTTTSSSSFAKGKNTYLSPTKKRTSTPRSSSLDRISGSSSPVDHEDNFGRAQFTDSDQNFHSQTSCYEESVSEDQDFFSFSKTEDSRLEEESHSTVDDKSQGETSDDFSSFQNTEAEDSLNLTTQQSLTENKSLALINDHFDQYSISLSSSSSFSSSSVFSGSSSVIDSSDENTEEELVSEEQNNVEISKLDGGSTTKFNSLPTNFSLSVSQEGPKDFSFGVSRSIQQLGVEVSPQLIREYIQNINDLTFLLKIQKILQVEKIDQSFFTLPNSVSVSLGSFLQLFGNNKLNDELMNCLVTLSVGSSSKNITFFTSYQFHHQTQNIVFNRTDQLKSKPLSSKVSLFESELYVCLLNWSNIHWGFMTFDPLHSQIEFFDSLHSFDPTEAQITTFLSLISRSMGKKKRIKFNNLVRIDGPVQCNQWSCGWWAVLKLHQVLGNLPSSIDISRFSEFQLQTTVFCQVFYMNISASIFRSVNLNTS